MDKVLIICGPTATGKTKLGLRLGKKFNGEVVSADSRQVYIGQNIITGKDLPLHSQPHSSALKWRGRYLKFYSLQGVKIWLYDVVYPQEPFNIAFWKECADLVITHILSVGKVPIVVGGTGLYLKSLTQSLNQATTPPNPRLRQKIAGRTPDFLFAYLAKLDSTKAASLNQSDRRNPRRLIRAIEIACHSKKETPFVEGTFFDTLQVGLTAPRNHLYSLVNQRVLDRIAAGASSEDLLLASAPSKWQAQEHAIIRHQLTWFKKQPGIHWFDITEPSWQSKTEHLISTWYNTLST